MATGDVYRAFGGRSSPFVASLPSKVGTSPQLSGHGSPEDTVPGVPGQTYHDIDSDNLWLKMAGTAMMGWRLIGVVPPGGSGGGSGGGATIIYGGAADPNGVVAANVPAVYYADNGSVWVKTTVGVSTTGWSQIL